MDVTIVIPVHNRKEYIEETISHIPESYRLIIVDNNSTDGTYELCGLLVRLRRNTVLLRERKPGAAAARNCGLRACRTKWVYFFDSDDVFTSLPSRWNEDLDMICFPVAQARSGGRLKARAYKTVGDPYVHILNSMLDTVSMVFRTEWLRSIGGWNETCRVWDDWELGARALLCRPRLKWFDDKVRHHIKLHDDGITGNDFGSRYVDINHAIKTVFKTIYDAEDGEAKRQAYFALFLRSYITCGLYRREGNLEACEALRTQIYEQFRTNSQSHEAGGMLERYTASGGRGAWRLAMWIVRVMKQK